MRLDHAARCFAIANSDSQSALSERFANQRTQTTSKRHAPLSLMEHKMRTVLLAAKAGLLLALLALASCEATHTSRVTPSSDHAALDAQVPALLGKYRIASVGVALILDGRVVLERAYGEQSAGVAATPATHFNLASLTKPVTAEVLLRLVAARQVSLDEPMSSHWVDPDVASDARHRQLTLRSALSHQTGFPNWRGHSPDGKLTFAFAPGSAYGYSGEAFQYAAPRIHAHGLQWPSRRRTHVGLLRSRTPARRCDFEEWCRG